MDKWKLGVMFCFGIDFLVLRGGGGGGGGGRNIGTTSKT